jgi:hypothetical protein
VFDQVRDQKEKLLVSFYSWFDNVAKYRGEETEQFMASMAWPFLPKGHGADWMLSFRTVRIYSCWESFLQWDPSRIHATSSFMSTMLLLVGGLGQDWKCLTVLLFCELCFLFSHPHRVGFPTYISLTVVNYSHIMSPIDSNLIICFLVLKMLPCYCFQ